VKPASAERAAVLALADAAGRAILEVYGRGDGDVQWKDDRSPLTEADLAAHRIIVAGLQRLTPDLPVLSEESADVPWATRRAWSRYWLVDPLDGTREFLKRNGEFTVNIALIEDGEPVLGVVHAPVTGESWSGERGGVAYRRDAGGHERRLFVRVPPARPLRVAVSRSHLDERTAALIQRLGPIESASLGSSLKFCKLAEGALDLYPRFGPTSEWDTAAGQCVLEAAGGALVNLEGEPFRYNQRPSLLNGDFLAFGDPALPWRNWL
jgi:3'(2'), 5'-bisphosphate nucleotidase